MKILRWEAWIASQGTLAGWKLDETAASTVKIEDEVIEID